MTSLKPPEGFEICPHCEGNKTVFYEGRFERPCKVCHGRGIVDWIRRAMMPPTSKREKPISHLEQIKNREAYRKKMKERIKNDKYKSKC